jgi:hypothetical protein
MEGDRTALTVRFVVGFIRTATLDKQLIEAAKRESVPLLS